MKFTLSWLKEHLDTTASLADISKALTACGLEVESISDRSADLAPFTVAKILHAEKHPEADKLRVCRVLSDVGELQIVCGAPNAREGIHVALAKEGAVIPGNGMVIKKSKIRGVESNGMLCSLEELAVAGDSEGIVELPLSSEVGQSVAAVLGLNDPVIDIAITPNRADCLSVRGVARDLAAAGLGKLRDVPCYILNNHIINLFHSTTFNAFNSPINACVDVSGSECDSFSGFFIRNLENTINASWLKQRLEAVGQKSISPVVDITNYLMLDLGRPMHAYDADKIHGDIRVRNAYDNEKFLALNDVEYALSPSMVVIADNDNIIGLAGIIGGKSTACSSTTTNVFLEVANFNSSNIAYTARKLDILSEARYRFERKVDSHTHIKLHTAESLACWDVPTLAAGLINRLCGGEVSYSVDTLVSGGWTPEPIPFSPKSVEKLGGILLEEERIEGILNALEFEFINTNEGWDVTPPSWRNDVKLEADLVEEVLRIHGYDHIPTVSLPKLPTMAKAAYAPMQKRAHIAKRALAARGMMELCTWSFLPTARAVQFGGGNAALKLLNPINAELDMMRPSLLPNLIEAAKKNANRGFAATKLFEVGLQFADVSPQGQKLVASAIRTGNSTEQSYNGTLFSQSERASDVFDVKADALALLAALGMNKCDIIQGAPAWYHPGRSGTLTLGGKIILGYFGELHPALLKDHDVDGVVTGFELFLEAIPQARAKGKAKPSLKVSDFQAVERDFAFIVAENVSAADMTKAIAAAEKQLITGIEIFDVYAGQGVEAGKKSVAVKVTLQAADRTLSDAEIQAASAAIVAAASKAFGGQLRQ